MYERQAEFQFVHKEVSSFFVYNTHALHVTSQRQLCRHIFQIQYIKLCPVEVSFISINKFRILKYEHNTSGIGSCMQFHKYMSNINV